MISRLIIACIFFTSVTILNASSRFFGDFMHPIIGIVLYAIALNLVFFPWIRRGIILTILLEAGLIAAAICLTWFFVGI